MKRSNRFVYMKPLTQQDESTINLDQDNVKTSQNDEKTPTHCRFCGAFEFKQKKVPPYKGVPPLKVGVVCLKCGETTVISFQEFYKTHAIKGKK